MTTLNSGTVMLNVFGTSKDPVPLAKKDSVHGNVASNNSAWSSVKSRMSRKLSGGSTSWDKCKNLTPPKLPTSGEFELFKKSVDSYDCGAVMLLEEGDRRPTMRPTIAESFMRFITGVSCLLEGAFANIAGASIPGASEFVIMSFRRYQKIKQLMIDGYFDAGRTKEGVHQLPEPPFYYSPVRIQITCQTKDGIEHALEPFEQVICLFPSDYDGELGKDLQAIFDPFVDSLASLQRQYGYNRSEASGMFGQEEDNK